MVVWGGFTNSWGKEDRWKAREKWKDVYTQLNAEFQRIARKDKKAFFNEQYKELFNKIGDIKGTFHARMGLIKDRNGKDLTEADEIKKKW